METVKELIEFASTHKKLWLLPVLLIIVLVGSVLMLAQGSAIAPFIYAIF